MEIRTDMRNTVTVANRTQLVRVINELLYSVTSKSPLVVLMTIKRATSVRVYSKKSGYKLVISKLGAKQIVIKKLSEDQLIAIAPLLSL